MLMWFEEYISGNVYVCVWCTPGWKSYVNANNPKWFLRDLTEPGKCGCH